MKQQRGARTPRAAKQARFQRAIIEVVRQWPRQIGRGGELEVGGHRAESDPAPLRDGALWEPGGFQAKNVAKFSHR